jgi:putative ABC transport system permease protein
MITPLNKKLSRDLWNIKGQALAIVLVMAAGIAVFVIMFGVLDSLRLTQSTYYERYQFADVFASLKRAPQSLKKSISSIDGVSLTETRTTFSVTLQMPDMNEPASGKIISLPDGRAPQLNQLYLRSGRMVYPNESNSVVIDERFFKAHQLSLGDKVSVILNGYKRHLRVVGVALSPEYVYSLAPGALMPDARRYAIFWMSQRSLESAVNMKGAFNDISLKLERSANVDDVKQSLDFLLSPYGGLSAYGRDEQLSNFFVESELDQLESIGVIAPFIFLAVAAFLVNVVMSRQISTQREQIGMLKAVGYSDWDIAAHFLKMVSLLIVLASVLGLVAGTWMAAGMTKMYAVFFHFPILQYSFSIEVMIFSVSSCAVAAVLGTLFSIKRAAYLPPAEAMRPESPTVFKKSFLERVGLHKKLSFLTRIILRQLERRPMRAVLSTTGMALALAILMFSYFMEDSMNYLMDVQYGVIQREDVNVSFTESHSKKALGSIRAIPGVMRVEPVRYLPAKLISGHLEKTLAITGLESGAYLRRIIDHQLLPVGVRTDGLIISEKLARTLNLSTGDLVEVELLEGKRKKLIIPVVGMTQEFIGMGVYMELHSLSRLLDEIPRVNGAVMLLDENYNAQIYQALKQNPGIIGMNITSVLRQIFTDIMAENILMMVSVNILFASFISFGVIYNTARIALSERGRELASLRVLGLTRKEVSYLLFGELGLITMAAIPFGIYLGFLMIDGMASSLDTELYRIPIYVSNQTLGISTLILLACSSLSFYLVWHQVEKIDLVSAQKGVE